MRVTRFAPSTTGAPHLGTLVSAVFTYLHAKSIGAQFRVRLEDLDPARCKPEYASAMLELLEQFEFKWDGLDVQSRNLESYQSALDELAMSDRVYCCSCSRARLKELGNIAADGSYVYDNFCREHLWRPGDEHENLSLRLILNDGDIRFKDRRFGQQEFRVISDFGDPVILRKDGAFSYHFSSVLDDENAHVSDVVRGSDLLYSSPVQIAIREVLGLQVPAYLHHPLLMEEKNKKLAKLHGSLPVSSLLDHYTPHEILGYIAYWFRLSNDTSARKLSSLIPGFKWDLVPFENLRVSFHSGALVAQDIQE